MDILSNALYYQPTSYHMDNSSWLQARQNAINSTDEYNQKAQNYKTQIETTLAAIPFNEKEDKFKQEYIDRLNQVAEDNGTKLGIGTSLNALIAEYGNIMKDPQFLGRIEAQEAFTTFQNAVKQNTTLSEDQKEYYLEKNPYYYVDKVIDADGNEKQRVDRQFEIGDKVIGGSKWEPALIPQNRPNYNDIFVTALKQVATNKWHSSGFTFYDENGNKVTDVNKADFSKIYIQNDVTGEKLEGDKLWEEIKSLLNKSPQVINAIKQDLEFARWYGEKHPDEIVNGATLYGGYVNGQPVTNIDDYIKWLFDGSVKTSTFNNVSRQQQIHAPSITTSDTSGKSGTSGTKRNPLEAALTSTATGQAINFTYKTGAVAQANMANSRNSLINTFKDLETSIGNVSSFKVSDGKWYVDGQELVDFNNIQENDSTVISTVLLRMVKEGRISFDQYQNVYSKTVRSIDNYLDEQATYDAMMENITNKEDKDKATFLMRKDNSDFMLDNNNVADAQIIKLKNKLNFGEDNKAHIIMPNYAYNGIIKYCTNNGIDINNDDYGIKINRVKDGNEYDFIIDKNYDNGLLLFADLCNNDILFNSGRGLNTTYLALNANLLEQIKIGKDIISKINEFEKDVDEQITQNLTITSQLTPAEDVISASIRTHLSKIDNGTYTKLSNEVVQDIYDKAATADFVQQQMFGLGIDNDGHGVSQEIKDSEERARYTDQIRTAARHKTLTPVATTVPGIGVGITLTFPLYTEDDKTDGTKTRSIFVPSLISSEIADEINNDPSTMALNSIALHNVKGSTIRVGNLKTLGNVQLIGNGDTTYDIRIGDSVYKAKDKNSAQQLLSALYNYRDICNYIVGGLYNLKDEKTINGLYGAMKIIANTLSSELNMNYNVVHDRLVSILK